MTIRALVLGLLLAAGLTLFSYHLLLDLGQTPLIGHYLPVGVFGVLLLLVLTINPLLHKLGLGGPLTLAELALAAAIALSVCTWPLKGLLTRFTPIVAWPMHSYRSHTGWQGADLLSYVPGGSPLLAEGHVRDWPVLVQRLHDARHVPDDQPLGRLWASLPTTTQFRLNQSVHEVTLPRDQRRAILHGLNTAMGVRVWDQPIPDQTHAQVNRRMLERLWPELIVPQPRGSGVMVSPADPARAQLDTLVSGRGAEAWGITELPWRGWWPTLRLWGLVVVGVALACVCMSLIVHRQWAVHEVLAFPITQFFQEATRSKPASPWPSVATKTSFWVSMGAIVAVHLYKGLGVWGSGMPTLSLRLPFTPLRELFPDAARAPGSFGVFEPLVIPTVIAFAYFLPMQIGFTLGISVVLWLALAAYMIKLGVPVSYAGVDPEPLTMVTVGAWLAAVGMIAYLGRRYYTQVLRAAVGVPANGESQPVARSAVWGLRLLPFCLGVAGYALCTWGGLDWVIVTMLLGLVVVNHLVCARMVAEAGVFVISCGWLPIAAMTGWLGAAAVGPTVALVVGMAGQLLVRGDTPMPFMLQAIDLGKRLGGVRRGRLAMGLSLVCVLGLAAAMAVTLMLQYNRGMGNYRAPGVGHWAGSMMDRAMRVTSELAATDQLVESVTVQGVDRLLAVNPSSGAITWTLTGIGAYLLLSFLRLRLPWWPLHPLVLLYFGQYLGHVVSFSFLLGWLVKACVVNIGGTRGYEAGKPAMVGIIVGEFVASLGWIAVGVGYSLFTGRLAPAYNVVPM